jgi:hypothetical protein
MINKPQESGTIRVSEIATPTINNNDPTAIAARSLAREGRILN